MKFFTKMCLVVGVFAGTFGAASAYSGEDYTVCKLNPEGDNFLAIRTCGSTTCQMTGKLEPGTIVNSLEPVPENGWRNVYVGTAHDNHLGIGPDQIKGWVFNAYLCKIEY